MPFSDLSDIFSGSVDELTTEQAVDIGKRQQAIRRRISEMSIERITFPLHCLPPRLEEFVRGYMKVFDVPADHYGLGILCCAGAAIGNAARIDDRGTDHPAVIYGTMVDLPGSGKTPTLKTLLAPFKRREKELRREHRQKMRELAAEAASAGGPAPLPRGYEQVLYNDFTLESLVDGLKVSPRGVFAYHDEIEGFLGSMDRYRNGKGGDGPFWLSAHVGDSVKINRRNRPDPIFIERVFCPFLGGIQPELIDTFSNDSRASSGFLARVLFSIPGRTVKQPYHNQRPDPSHAEAWERVINRIFEVQPAQREDDGENEAGESDVSIVPHNIPMSSDAKAVYKGFYDGLAEKVNNCDDTVERSTLIKFETHALRFALILHFLDWGCQHPGSSWMAAVGYVGPDEIVQKEISRSCMERAVKICEYFMATGLQVVGKLRAPYKSLPPSQVIWYEELSEEPSTAEAQETGKTAGISEATVSRLLKDKQLFQRVRRGIYLKLHS